MHQWRFFKAGGFDQVSLTQGSDYAHLAELDQKLWVALGCPVNGLQFDSATMALIDNDGDGRIRAPELLQAIDWTLHRLVSPEQLLASDDVLPLASIDSGKQAGASIAAAARTVLAEAGRGDDDCIDLATAAGAAALLTARALNGDGVVSADSTDDAPVKALVTAIVAGGFGVSGRDGKCGVDAAGAQAFSELVRASLDWYAEADGAAATLLPAGDNTAAAWEAVSALDAKIEDFFARCRLAAFDARAETALNREESAWLALAAQDLGISNEEIRGFPLARVSPVARLSLEHGINPAWADAVEALRSAAVVPLFGERGELSWQEWRQLVGVLRPFADWQARRPAAAVSALGVEALADLAQPATHQALLALIEADQQFAGAYAALDELVKLIRLRRDLATLSRNFVNFSDFYGQERPAIFQCGTLYLDQRSCTLCLQVTDAAKHAALAAMAGAYLAYCDCVRKGSGESMQIVAAFTDGDSDNLMVGRNGIFYDRAGRDWDATITRIVDNPISVRQAFWSPYKKLARFVEEQVAKRAAAADAAAGDKMQASVVKAGAVAEGGEAPAQKKIDVGTVAALGVALGSIGTAFGYFLKTAADVKGWQVPVLLLALMLIISGPSMIMAIMKLRRRNLAPLLDANGWAINARALVNVPFGATLTDVAHLPPGARSGAADRFAVKGSSWPKLLMFGFIAWWLYAFLSDMGVLRMLLER
jgi:hypothetical protein